MRSYATKLVVALAGALLGACGDSSARTPTSPGAPGAPPAGERPAPGPPVFTDVAAEAGLTAENHTGVPRWKEWLASAMGGGAIVLDYDQDGRMDLVVVDGTMLTDRGELKFHDDWRTRVYRNLGGMKFAEVTRTCGVDLAAFGVGGASCDYDADGFPDFYVCCWGRNRLFHNRRDGTFEEVAERAGVAGPEGDFSTGCCFGDLDGDGVVDLYVANYADQRALVETFRLEGRPPRSTFWRGISVATGPVGMAGQQDRLYFGNPDGTFRDVTAERLGVEPAEGYGFQPIMTDVDGDGDLDVYVPNDLSNNYLFLNDGRGNLVESGLAAGVAVDVGGRRQASMGVDAADVNRDGRLDLFVTNFSHDHNTLYVNETAKGRAAFQDLSIPYGVVTPSRTRVSWGTRLWDYDNDGDCDLFVACGHIYPEVDTYPAIGATYEERCLLLRNGGAPSWHFTDVSEQAGPPFQVARVWRGAAFADFDDDGDQDVFVTALNDRPALLRNDGGDANSFLVVRLVGAGKLRDPCGARVTIRLADGRPHVEELHHGASFGCDGDPRLFFGLGRETAARSVEIRWPGGATQSFADVAGRKFYVVEEGRDELREDKR